jgi:murein DD-endopeptidase MepM/ murein hydrolase activator NlpD
MAYVVKSGDTLSAIAKANGTTVQAIKDANPQITNVNLIKPGQAFTIPNSKSTSVNTGNPVIPDTGLLDLTKPENAASARLQAEADAYFAANPNIDPLTGKAKVVPQGETAEQIAARLKAEADKLKEDKANKDAYAILEDTLNTYGLSSLASVIKGYMLAGLGTEQAKLQIKQEPLYKARFKGNELRLASGLNALSEAEYLGVEDTYNQVMNQYGLGDYFGKTRETRQSKLADVIGGDISPVEFKDRISTVVERVNNADASIKTQLKQFYPSITETDLVKYFLDPKETLPQLQEKVTSAEIGAAAVSQKLDTSVTSATDLAKYGIDRATAVKGYSTIGGMLPETTKLNDIYGEAKINYTQKTAEEEVFKGNASAERKRKQLAALETAQFGGSAGVGSAGLSTQMLRKSSSAGQF